MKTPRFMLCGTNSGCGKTMTTCGILQALVNRGMKVAAFKCGPDYIDPMFHTKVIGAKSRNIDSFFADENTAKWLFTRNAKDSDISVIEGVMGYYDGISNTDQASSYEVAKVTKTPAVLVVNASGASISAAAMIKGFTEFRKDSQVAGVILNKITPGMYSFLKEAIERECGIRVYGYIPKNTQCAVESRHLGLVMPNEIEDLHNRLMQLAQIVEQTVDLDGLLALGASAPELEFTEPKSRCNGKGLKIAVARDEAFCFYYEDNLMLLRDAGCELVEFSPIHDRTLPRADGLILGGGYPELYGKALEANESMRASIREAIAGGMPAIAECGGFMYLHSTMRTKEEETFRMCDVIHGEVYYTGKLGRFGYIGLTSEEDSVFGPAGTCLRGHEFHYYDSSNTGVAFSASKPVSNRSWKCAHAEKNMICGFPHYYFYSNPEAVANFLEVCQKVGYGK